MKYNEVMKELKNLGTEETRKIYTRHGCDIDQFGVSIANLRKVMKPLKKDKDLGYKLFHSKNADAIYMSQWIVDSHQLTIDDIRTVLEDTEYYMILDNAIPNSIVKNRELTLQIINDFLHDDNFKYRQVAYALYSLILVKYDLSLLSLDHIKNTMDHVVEVIHQEQNRVRYNMNNFIIAAGGLDIYTSYAKQLADRIGKVEVFMGETSCKVPEASSYIDKMIEHNKIRKVNIS